jgi:hypothetical protein
VATNTESIPLLESPAVRIAPPGHSWAISLGGVSDYRELLYFIGRVSSKFVVSGSRRSGPLFDRHFRNAGPCRLAHSNGILSEDGDEVVDVV